MNVQRLIQLANFVEGNEQPFLMQGNCSCWLGHAWRLWPTEIKYYTAKYVAPYLDLTPEQANRLFYPQRFDGNENPHQDLKDITREQAVDTLRRFAETGYIDYWPDNTQ